METTKIRTSYKVLLAVLAVTIPATAGATVTAASMKKHAANPEHAAMMKQHFEAMDADKGGKVGQAEVFAYRAAKFTDADGNADGRISAVELDGLMAEHRIKFMEHRLAMMDTDGDGVVGQDEFARMRGPWMRHLDQNRDGVIDKEEVGNAGMRHARHHGGKHRMHGDN